MKRLTFEDWQVEVLDNSEKMFYVATALNLSRSLLAHSHFPLSKTFLIFSVTQLSLKAFYLYTNYKYSGDATNEKIQIECKSNTNRHHINTTYLLDNR